MTDSPEPGPESSPGTRSRTGPDSGPEIRPERAADAVVRVIERLILEGSLRPDDPLLPERALAERLNVSRPTLREGLKLLEDKGLVTIGRRGLRIASLGRQVIADPLMDLLSRHAELAEDYLEFRDIVESQAAALAASRATEADLARIRDCLARLDAAHSAADRVLEAEMDADLHQSIYEASHNLVLLQVMRVLAGGLRHDVLQNRQRLFVRPDTRDVLHGQHHAIAAAILARDPEAARLASHAHLGWLREAIREMRLAEQRQEVALRRLHGTELVARRSPGTDAVTARPGSALPSARQSSPSE